MRAIYLIPVATFLAGLFIGALAAGASDPGSGSSAPRPALDATSAIERDSPLPTPDSPPPEIKSATVVADEPLPMAPVPAPQPASSDMENRLLGMAAGWSRLESELARLSERVAGLERRLADVSASAQGAADAPPRARTPNQRRVALEVAGLARDLAADVVWRQGQHDLEQLELRDQAMREDWFGSDRYREEIRKLRDERPNLRAELGDELYDRYLYAAGDENRVRIEGLIAGSAAEDAGLRPGDLIESYDGTRVFTFGELRRATSEGERGEQVQVSVRRPDGERVQFWLPRGPLGVRLDLTHADPGA